MNGHNFASGRNERALLRLALSWSIFAMKAAPELRDGSVVEFAISRALSHFVDQV